MTKILLIGYNPPQIVPKVKIEAAHYRTWQFLQPLLDDGHTVCLCAGTRDEVAGADDVPPAWRAQLVYHPIAFGAGEWVKQLQAAHDAFAPACVVAVNFSHCLYATKLRTDAPIWMEIYGDLLTITQAAAYRAQSDRGIETQIAFMREVLRKGDIFSGCGRAQCHMMVGELAMTGRLNNRTFAYEFTRAILPGSPPRAVDGAAHAAPRYEAVVARDRDRRPGQPHAERAHRHLGTGDRVVADDARVQQVQDVAVERHRPLAAPQEIVLDRKCRGDQEC